MSLKILKIIKNGEDTVTTRKPFACTWFQLRFQMYRAYLRDEGDT